MRDGWIAEDGCRETSRSRFNGCPLTLSNDSAHECWTSHGTFGRVAVLGFSNVRRLCNECGDRVKLRGVFLREGVR